jgi:SET domain-containing protein
MPKPHRHFTPGVYDLRQKRSRTGLGLFSFSPIKKGACIIEYTGAPVPKHEHQTRTGKYLFWTSRNTMIDGNIRSNTARFINHSCAPNCEIDLYWKRVFVFAKRNIKAGEELSYDYDTEYFEEHIRPKGCRCFKCDPR